MRLVDADKIKEEVALMWGDNSHITESVYEIIDNIPTEETSERCSSCRVKEGE